MTGGLGKSTAGGGRGIKKNKRELLLAEGRVYGGTAGADVNFIESRYIPGRCG